MVYVWPKFRFKLRRDNKKKNSYESRVYESVEDRSLYLMLSPVTVSGPESPGYVT